MSSVLTGGRISSTRPDVVKFISSLKEDQRIARPTVLVNEAHILALLRCGALQKPAAAKILRALRQLEGRKITDKKGEDVHVVIEDFVTRRAGAMVGGLMHLGKSRNDQVVTAVRMALRDEMFQLAELLSKLEFTLIRLAKQHSESVFPGYTHLQPAQPISFAQYLLANCFSLIRDSERLAESYARVNHSPMGAGALAGTSFRINRGMVAGLLGFDGTIEASLDAVGGRDFALEVLAVVALIALDLSRFSSDLLFFSSAEAALIEIPDDFTSTSSIMPQKKNADPLELIRAKSAVTAANFAAAVTIVHGLPSGYNLDYQELTPILWHGLEEVNACLRILNGLVPRLKVQKGIAGRKYLQFTAATEIANILVREESLPFRAAHRRVGSLVRIALESGRSLGDTQRGDWSKILGREPRRNTLRLIQHALDLRRHLWLYQTAGSPNPNETMRLVRSATSHCKHLAVFWAAAHRRVEASLVILRKKAREASR